ncbi:cob(I)yrinic acid a,c-diamide adenosyltransferase [Acididesulfobacillus acetoxydans]|uniref:Cob(I)alamin adenosyltransferase n=1 Tax=Acididesulfobacillus acetoxydans TaxID=1561005 RepID=A0A8S0WFP7_9FIRM|nr:cob(I)yrinic acid a,c-diamide adenosyltransferase [Acididesulfobacillus acetoxydans]CAA7601242.1 cob(I)yrinic acid a,c-diamide adenosyltransferase [Acididesulfobacillus acetoxydans]CEJ08479.1 Cob(I)alamin adenosyltransferase [Acididesulfobacillus acetoxydans]
MSRLKQGLVQLYTGNSKGKTTAAFGLAVRAVGHGFHVCIIQFMKGRDDYGELAGFKRLEPECCLEHFGTAGWVRKGQASDEDIREARRAWTRAVEVVMSGEWDIVVLDEVVNAIWFELLPEEEILHLLGQKPDRVEVVLTGRNASETLIAAADLVTEMVQIKHPYEKGIPAREGIEF